MSTLNPQGRTISPVSNRVHIFFDGDEIASTSKALKLEQPGRETRYYFPIEDVHPSILEASDTKRQEDGLGEAHYYNIKTLTADGEDLAWYYPYAEGDYAELRDLITFGGNRISIQVTGG
ncbi:DUF427 domain-containing protein [Devosia sp. WQ 349]|uniref:DUF427 domain-containing protein n=1 Tax=Devosia sp. WQ 349K1 TaxID=2800329 RepID=UPI0019034243|nr:DUF427 domain-containing protein [Devosia sp. WQ 349K1]MBK1794594.1 DUF427 domain-containing protein [Devosia sp. WQ 349K1]